nr:F-box/LRR-repeat protein fbxl-1-like [Dasypus novemcinctus]
MVLDLWSYFGFLRQLRIHVFKQQNPNKERAHDAYKGKQIRIADCQVLQDDWLLALACRHPRSLTLHRCRDDARAVTQDGLKRLFQHCRDFLQELNVTSCCGPGLMGDRVLLQAGPLCRRLTAVDISWSGATDVGVMALVEGTSSLHRIEVFGCLALTDRSIGSLALQCSQLRTLNIGRVPKVSECCLVRSLQNLRAVSALNVAGLRMVSDKIVHLTVTQCPKLDSLVLSSCSQVTDVSLVEISTYLPTLRYLDVSGCRQVTDVGIHALARGCHQLNYLDVSSTGISKRGMSELIGHPPSGGYFSDSKGPHMSI